MLQVRPMQPLQTLHHFNHSKLKTTLWLEVSGTFVDRCSMYSRLEFRFGYRFDLRFVFRVSFPANSTSNGLKVWYRLSLDSRPLITPCVRSGEPWGGSFDVSRFIRTHEHSLVSLDSKIFLVGARPFYYLT